MHKSTMFKTKTYHLKSDLTGTFLGKTYLAFLMKRPVNVFRYPCEQVATKEILGHMLVPSRIEHYFTHALSRCVIAITKKRYQNALRQSNLKKEQSVHAFLNV